MASRNGTSVLGEVDDRSVAVIGGGVAGITAATKLFRQGYNVTLFEKASVLGGNFSSNAADNNNKPRDIYPHIIGDWYREFWYLLEKDFRLERKDLFAKRDKIKIAMITDKKAKSFADVRFDELATPTSLKNLFNDLRSGAVSMRDMILFGYTYLDLVSVPRRDEALPVLDALDVTGYLYSRPFMNENIAELHDAILKVIWSMPSEQTSAKAYQDLVRHTLTFPRETPFAWLVKGPIDKMIMEPITRQLRDAFANSGGSKLRLGTEVKTIDVEGQTVFITTDESTPEKFRFAIVATPCSAALKLALSGGPKTRLMDCARSLAPFRQGKTGRIPVVYLYFTDEFVKRQGKTLSALPRELIGFKSLREGDTKEIGTKTSGAPTELDYDISILDISRLWNPKDLDRHNGYEPVFVLAASRADSIPEPGPGEGDNSGKRQGFAMIQKLAYYFRFIDPGNEWGQGGDIDWGRTCVVTNQQNQLFLNDAGTESWRPRARVQGLENVFFAGDYCLTDVNMATIEAAVQSGVLAAQEIQKEVKHGHYIHLQPHTLYANSVFLLVKLGSMPLAAAVALTELYEEAMLSPMNFAAFPFTVLTRGAAFGSDWIKTAIQLFESFVHQHERSPTGAPSYQNVAVQDHRIGLATWVRLLVSDVVKEGPWLKVAAMETAGEIVNAWWERLTGHAPRVKPRAGVWPPPVIDEVHPSNAGAVSPDPIWTTLYRTLAPSDLSPEGLSDAATGVSTTMNKLIENLANATPPPEAGRPNYSDALRSAVKAGAEARREKERRYRVYNAVRDL